MSVTAFQAKVEQCLVRAVDESVKIGRSPWVTPSAIAMRVYGGGWAALPGRSSAVGRALRVLSDRELAIEAGGLWTVWDDVDESPESEVPS